MAANDRKQADEPVPNDALLELSKERLSRLLAVDPEVQRSRCSLEAIEAIRSCPTTIEAIAKAFELYADRPCLGERAFVATEAGIHFLSEFRTIRYAEVWARVETFASGLLHEGLVGPGTFVGILGFGSADWVVADLTCVYLAAVSVPIQTGMSAADFAQIVREAELACIVCSVEQLGAVEGVLPQCPSVRSVVVIDLREGDRAAETELAEWMSEASSGEKPTIRTIQEVETRGLTEGIVPKILPSARQEADPLMSLVYTSGSTGTPKGAMVTESLLRLHWQEFFGRPVERLPELPQISVNYMPLNHLAGRGGVIRAIVAGGVTYFVAKSDMSTLFEDIRLALPTTLLLVPRVAGAIYQHFLGEVVRLAPSGASAEERERIGEQIMNSMRSSFLGDRLLLVVTGSAPTPPEVVRFIQRCFDVPVIDAYGSTEAGPITMEGRADPAELTWKLVDMPELGYRTSDQPYPRGELHVKSRFLVPGYYKNERASKDLFDADGFLNTGDIVEQRGPDRLVWIDRAKNILKLAQGEFVATSRLEGIYASRSAFIRQIFVYGNGLRSYLLAVVVPDLEAADTKLRQEGKEPDDAALRQLVRSEMNRIALEEQLHGWEVPRDFILEREPFTVESGLLTGSNKPSRPQLRARYGEALEAMYVEIERAQVEELYGLRGELAKASVGEKVKKAIEVTLGLPNIDARQTEQSFIQLGGDSLSAVGLETLIEEISGVQVPGGYLLDPTKSVRGVVEFVEDALAGKRRRTITFADVHGADAKTVRASDLQIEKFLGADEIAAARSATPASELPRPAEVALLTGANGFLGRLLLLELAERLAGEKRKLYALVRARNDEEAFDRLARTYDTDPALAARFIALAGRGAGGTGAANARLVVLAGDLTTPRFGLADDVYTRLSEEVDLVVHNGALVNHAFDYEKLFEPNVLGTVEVLRFALARFVKSIAYVSTVGAVAGAPRTGAPTPGLILEDEDIRALVPMRPIDAGYASGYGTSKWASEVLLRDAHDKLGVPVSVFRPSGILADSRYRGQVNVPDFFTRLLAGIIYTGIAPRSFYAPGASERAKHYDGLPADVVARSIVAPSVLREPEEEKHWRTYHVVNPHHDDGISLDVIVHWVKTAGYRVERIADYDAWYRTFHDRLIGLGESQKHHSPLPILNAWAEPRGERDIFDATRLLERLGAISPSLADLPHVSEALIHKYLVDMAAHGVIEPPRLRMTGT